MSELKSASGAAGKLGEVSNAWKCDCLLRVWGEPELGAEFVGGPAWDSVWAGMGSDCSTPISYQETPTSLQLPCSSEDSLSTLARCCRGSVWDRWCGVTVWVCCWLMVLSAKWCCCPGLLNPTGDGVLSTIAGCCRGSVWGEWCGVTVWGECCSGCMLGPWYMVPTSPQGCWSCDGVLSTLAGCWRGSVLRRDCRLSMSDGCCTGCVLGRWCMVTPAKWRCGTELLVLPGSDKSVTGDWMAELSMPMSGDRIKCCSDAISFCLKQALTFCIWSSLASCSDQDSFCLSDLFPWDKSNSVLFSDI